jgi:hypothetical protein
MFQLDQKTARAIKKFPHRAVDIVQSFDEKQIKCKQWLYEELLNIPIPTSKRIYIAGSWYGNILVPYIQKLYPKTEIRLHDIDEETIYIAKNIFFGNDPFIKSDVINSNEYEYKYFVINTSCEHMMPLQIKSNTHVVLQSNNYFEIEDHINCVNSVDELIDQYNLKEVYYKGELEFEKYTRFMVIGKT